MNSALQFVTRWRFPGLFLLLTVEESGVPMPLPGDWVIVALGALSRDSGGFQSGVITVVIATLAVTLGGSVLFALARGAARPALLRLSRRVGLHDERRERLEGWLKRRAVVTLIVGRLIPAVRVPLTLTSGVMAMPRSLFMLGLVPAAMIWSATYFSIGYALGATYEELAPRLPRYGAGVAAAAAIVLLTFALRGWLLARRAKP